MTSARSDCIAAGPVLPAATLADRCLDGLDLAPKHLDLLQLVELRGVYALFPELPLTHRVRSAAFVRPKRGHDGLCAMPRGPRAQHRSYLRAGNVQRVSVCQQRLSLAAHPTGGRGRQNEMDNSGA